MRYATLLRYKAKLHYFLWRCRTYHIRRRYAITFCCDPDLTFWISPDRIQLAFVPSVLGHLDIEISPLEITPAIERGKVVDGDWDLQVIPFEDSSVWKAFRHRFIVHGSWSETSFYDRVVSTIRRGTVLWNCRTKEEFDLRLRQIEMLFKDIEQNGYKPQTSINDSFKALGKEDEIHVHIGRNGDYIFADGRHRLCIAKILNLPKIPVKVARRHTQWSSFRAEILAYARKGDGVYALILHPDLSDIPAVHGHERMEIIKIHLPEKPGRMLDIGAHWGYFCHRFEDLGYQCMAVENSLLNVRFMEKLRRAENRHFEIFAGSIFAADFSTTFDVVLSLNIFHHFLKEETLYKNLVKFLRSLDAKVMFFEPHDPDEPQMKTSFANYGPDEFVEFVRVHGQFASAERIGVSPDGRPLFKLVR